MAATQTVVFTVLPAGRAGVGNAKRRFSVHVAPRLSGASYLSSFTDFVDWAKFAADAMASVRLKVVGASPGYSTLTTVEATRISVDPVNLFWNELFNNPNTLPVDDFDRTAFAGRFGQSRFHSYPVVPLHEFHTKLFFELAQSNETKPPSRATLISKLKSLTGINDDDARKRVTGKFLTAFNKGAGAPFTKVLPHGSGRPDVTAGTDESPLGDHMQVQRFMEPRTSVAYMLANPVVAPRLDFHRIVAMLADHPYLMRRLGLVMDYEISAAAAGGAPELTSAVFLQLDSGDDWVSGVAGTKSFPRTRVDPSRFLARPKVSTRVNLAGSLNLRETYTPKTGTGWQVISLDVEGTALKAIGLADSAARAANIATKEAAANAPASLDVPAPRSGGLSLVRAGRAPEVVADFKRSAALLDGASAPGGSPSGSGDGVELYAEDLIRGWRVDVWDTSTSRWRSITRRDQDYTLGAFPSTVTAQETLVVPDGVVDGWSTGERPLYLTEGVISLGVTASADPSKTAADTFVQEQVLEWTGWSLVAPRPGRTLSAAENVPVDQATPTNDRLGLQIRTQVPDGTLPRLRYGRSYRFRLRSANLAGAGPAMSTASVIDDLTETPSTETPYLRFEPVPPPVVVQTANLTTGESITNLVIYSEDETTPIASIGQSSRHLAPPGANAHLVELHGVLDTMAPATAYSVLAEREGAKLVGGDAAPAWMSGAGYVPYSEVASDTNSGIAKSPVVDGELPQPPWLLDPAAFGLRIVGPEMGTEAAKYASGPLGWADRRTSRVTLRGLGVNVPSTLDLESASLSDGSVTTRRFRVGVPKGEQFTLTMTSLLTPSFGKHFGIINLLNTRKPVPVGLAARLSRAIQGLNRFVTAPTLLTVVHATRRPVAEPRPLSVGTSRSPGGTSATFTTRVACHPQSTSQLDLNLDWTEWSDSGPTAPINTDGRGTAQAFIVKYPNPGVRPTLISTSGQGFEFGDTKHRYVRFRYTATSRYARYFLETVTRTLGNSGTTIDFSATGVQPLSERVVIKTTGAVLTRNKDYSIDYATGVLTMLTSAYNLRIAEIEYVPDNVTRQTQLANAKSYHVPSTARPQPPVVRDVMPTFADSAWLPVKNKFGGVVGRKHTRNGRVLRVYLERPWYSSGDNEMLGVVLLPFFLLGSRPGYVAAPPTTGLPKAPQQMYTSAWGRDPLRVGSPTRATLNAANFPLAVPSPFHTTKWVQNLTVPGTAQRVTAVPHAVQYDEDQQLWYSDIEIDLGDAYRPFVRLALARFQPYSLADCHLSAVTLIDTAQLSPTRTLTVLGTGQTRTVTITGPMYKDATTGIPQDSQPEAERTPQASLPPKFEITVQHRPLALADRPDFDALGWEDVLDPIGGGEIGGQAGYQARTYLMTPAAGTNLNGIGKFVASNVNVASPSSQNGPMQVRLVIREYERDTRSFAQLTLSIFNPAFGYRQRLAFMDTFIVN